MFNNENDSLKETIIYHCERELHESVPWNEFPPSHIEDVIKLHKIVKNNTIENKDYYKIMLESYGFGVDYLIQRGYILY